MLWKWKQRQGGELYPSRDKIYPQRKASDVQRLWLAAARSLPTVPIVFLKVAPGQNFSVIVFDLEKQLPPVYFPASTSEEASWASSIAEAMAKSILTPTVGLISLCCQIAVVTRV